MLEIRPTAAPCHPPAHPPVPPRTGIPDIDAFLRNTGLVMQYLYRDQAPEPGQYDALWARPELLPRLASCATELVVVALARGWPALTRLLLPAVNAGRSASCSCS